MFNVDKNTKHKTKQNKKQQQQQQQQTQNKTKNLTEIIYAFLKSSLRTLNCCSSMLMIKLSVIICLPRDSFLS